MGVASRDASSLLKLLSLGSAAKSRGLDLDLEFLRFDLPRERSGRGVSEIEVK